MKTIKFAKVLVLIAILIGITGFTWSTNQSSTIVKLVPQAPKIAIGETTTVDLVVEKVSGLYGAQVRIKFDPTVLQVVDADPNQEGVQLTPGELPIPDFVVQNLADNQTGVIDYAATQLPPNEPVTGTGIMAQITFQAKKAAVSQLELEELLLADTAGGSIKVVSQHSRIQVAGSFTGVLIIAASVVLLIAITSIGFIVIKRKGA